MGNGACVIPFPGRAPDPTFEWWAENRRLLAPKTIEDYTYWIGVAESRLADKHITLSQITHHQLFAYFDTLRPTYSVRKNVRCALVAYFDYLIMVEARTDNPAVSLPKMKRPKAVPKPLPAGRIPEFLRVAYRDRAPVLPCLCVLYLNTGLRLTELCTRRKDDRVDDHLYIKVKGGGQRCVYLNSAAVQALDLWESQRPTIAPDTTWMFPSPRFPDRHISTDWVYDKIRSFGEKAGISGCRPHRLRHTFASTLYAQSRDILLVKEALGHSDIKNTLVYTQTHLFGVQEAMEKLSFES